MPEEGRILVPERRDGISWSAAVWVRQA